MTYIMPSAVTAYVGIFVTSKIHCRSCLFRLCSNLRMFLLRLPAAIAVMVCDCSELNIDTYMYVE